MSNSPITSPQFKSLLNQCVHCGLCLPACPTYAVFGTEMDAPRGRIALMRAASDGRIELDGVFRAHISLCLACRACEPACPSGVKYGALIETARVAIEHTHKPGIVERAIRRLALREMMPRVNRLRWMARAMRVYQRLGLQKLVRGLNILPKNLRAMEALLPPLPARYSSYRGIAPALGKRYGKVAFFYGCIQDAFLADVNAATVRVLQRNGYQVHFPTRQTCCGAAQLHVGEEALTRDLARQNVDVFLAADYAAVIVNAGGCGATLKEYAHLLRDDAAYADKARRFVERVQDVNEFLAEHLNATPKGRLNARVTYADSCHLRNAQKVVKPPRDLLRAIPGIELVELAQPDRCCGSAGVYNIVEAETADMILDAKMVDIAETGADTIAVTNTGCHLQLLAGVRRTRLNARVAHVVELLDESYTAET